MHRRNPYIPEKDSPKEPLKITMAMEMSIIAKLSVAGFINLDNLAKMNFIGQEEAKIAITSLAQKQDDIALTKVGIKPFFGTFQIPGDAVAEEQVNQAILAQIDEQAYLTPIGKIDDHNAHFYIIQQLYDTGKLGLKNLKKANFKVSQAECEQVGLDFKEFEVLLTLGLISDEYASPELRYLVANEDRTLPDNVEIIIRRQETRDLLMKQALEEGGLSAGTIVQGPRKLQ